jgi:hypothetical protein
VLEDANCIVNPFSDVSYDVNAQPPSCLVFRNISTGPGERHIDVDTGIVSKDCGVTTGSIPDSEHIISPSSQTLQGNGKASDGGGHQPSFLKKLAMEREERMTSSLSHGGASILHHKKTVGPAELADTSSKSGLSQETSTQPRNITIAGWVATKGSLLGTITDEELQAASGIMSRGGIATPEAVAKELGRAI